MDFFKKRREIMLERARRRAVKIELSDRISSEQKNLVNTVDEQFKNQAEGIKALAEAEKALAEVDAMEKKNSNEHARGLLGLAVGAAKAVGSVLLIASVYGLEKDGGWFISNKESARMANDNLRESMRDERKY